MIGSVSSAQQPAPQTTSWSGEVTTVSAGSA